MGVFDLLFIGIFLATIIYSVWMVSLAARRRWSSMRCHAPGLGGSLAGYMLVVGAVGLLSPRRVAS